MTPAGQPVTEVVVKRDTAGEVARLFLMEREKEGAIPGMKEVGSTHLCLSISLPHSPSLSLPPSPSLSLPPSQIIETLSTHPLESLRPSEKVQVLTVLLNELMCSPDLCREVDIRMEQIATFRREKWKINLKLKRCVSFNTYVYVHVNDHEICRRKEERS